MVPGGERERYDRTPSSTPGIRGLPGATAEDRGMWDEFHREMPVLAPESEQLLHDLFTRDPNAELDFLHGDKVQVEPKPRLTAPAGPTEVQASVRVRRGQQFFRQTILNAYGVRCCISGINVPSLLVASHIKPWHEFSEERLNPRNGLCLSCLHDAAFDNGLITFDEQFKLVLSKHLRRFFPQPTLEKNFREFEGKPIELPEKVAEPDEAFLSFHRTTVFVV
jgi:putative restriction endonuclease